MGSELNIESLIARLRHIESKATPGEWIQGHHVGEPRAITTKAAPDTSLLAVDGDGMAIFDRAENAALAVAARNALPTLLAAIDPTSKGSTVDVAKYPVCPLCEAPFILRRATSLTNGRESWIWQRDCGHRSPSPEIRAARGSK
jgi:hypothetical protein